MKKIVIISQCIFPRMAPRAYRATELAKYFASYGHDVYLYAVLGKYDYSCFEQETGVHVRSLGKMKFSIGDSDGNRRNGLLDTVGRKLFKKILEYPDIELCWKVSQLIKNLSKIDMLITIAVPHPIHWGAAWAKKKMGSAFPKVWVSDCGDPYMGDSETKHPFYFRYIENYWGEKTDYITIPIKEGMKGYSPKIHNKIRIIPQGFDFSNTKTDESFTGNEIPHFAYIGTVYPGYRDPSKMLQYLAKQQRDFVFVVYTKNPHYYCQYKEMLGDKLQLKSYVPREQLIFELSQMDFLVNLQNKSSIQAPSKLIDYYLTGRPIIDITSEFSEEETLSDFLNGDYSRQHHKQDISQYDIRNVGNAFLGLFAEGNN